MMVMVNMMRGRGGRVCIGFIGGPGVCDCVSAGVDLADNDGLFEKWGGEGLNKRKVEVGCVCGSRWWREESREEKGVTRIFAFYSDESISRRCHIKANNAHFLSSSLPSP